MEAEEVCVKPIYSFRESLDPSSRKELIKAAFGAIDRKVGFGLDPLGAQCVTSAYAGWKNGFWRGSIRTPGNVEGFLCAGWN